LRKLELLDRNLKEKGDRRDVEKKKNLISGKKNKTEIRWEENITLRQEGDFEKKQTQRSGQRLKGGGDCPGNLGL